VSADNPKTGDDQIGNQRPENAQDRRTSDQMDKNGDSGISFHEFQAEVIKNSSIFANVNKNMNHLLNASETVGPQFISAPMSNELLAILNELSSHPIALLFTSPTSESQYVEDDYSQVISSPMDLSRIRPAIQTGGYSLAKLERDVALISTNRVRYFGRNTEFAFAGDYLVKVLEKKIAKRRSSCNQ
jgi:hypothetical protein